MLGASGDSRLAHLQNVVMPAHIDTRQTTHRFLNNTAHFMGGAMYRTTEGDLAITGHNHGVGSVRINACQFIGNNGEVGGALMQEGDGTVAVENSIFELNRVSNTGAAIASMCGYTVTCDGGRSALNLQNTTFTRNSGSYGTIHTKFT